jgi:hypothetical protein
MPAYSLSPSAALRLSVLCAHSITVYMKRSCTLLTTPQSPFSTFASPTPSRRASTPLHPDSRRRPRKSEKRFSDFYFFYKPFVLQTDVESTSSTWLTAFRVVGCQSNRETPDSQVQNAHGAGAAGACQGRSKGLIRPSMLLCRGVA